MPGPKTQAQRAINAPHVPGGTTPPIRQPAHPGAGPAQPRERIAGRPRLTTLRPCAKPTGSAGRGGDNSGEGKPSKKKRTGYNLQEALGLSEKQYRVAWGVIKIMCGKYLDTTKSFEAQNGGAVLECISHIRFELDEFEAFEDPLWPIRDFLIMTLRLSANGWSTLCRETNAESDNTSGSGETNNQGGNNDDSGALDTGTASVPAPPPASMPAPTPTQAPATSSTLAPGSAALPAPETIPTSQSTSRPRPKPKARTTGKRKKTDEPDDEPEPAPEPQPDDEPQPNPQPGEAEPDDGSEAEAEAQPAENSSAPPTPPPATKAKGKGKGKTQSGPVQLAKEPIPEFPPAKRQKRSNPAPDETSSSSADEATTPAEQTGAATGKTRAAIAKAAGKATTGKATTGKAATTKAATTKAATAKAKAATAKAKAAAKKATAGT
ncbi:hypothetical protein FRC10_010911 [Ceratobasidium sp. 414]|nr:hypothetical protein FRC10_010911 [Ceratobasidium sp. 414]